MPSRLTLAHAHVSPGKVFFDGGRKAKVSFRFGGSGRRDVRVRAVRRRDGRVMRSWLRHGLRPGVNHAQRWGGTRSNGKIAGDGHYVFRVGGLNGKGKRAGGFMLHGYEFPVDGPHGTRGPIGAFHAPRSGGRIHEGFDITASCGTPIRAARGGRVRKVGYDPVLYGNYALIRGRGTHRSTFYAHMVHRARVRRGEHVHTGQRLGRVGQTGNAAGTPCHLHFELRHRGRPVDPEPKLKRWDRWS